MVGEVALLERSSDVDNVRPWRPRPVAELNRDLSRCYGLPIEIEPKARGLEAVAQALGCGDLAHAQMVALHLCFPDPLDLEKSAGDVQALVDLARRLDASGLLKRDFDSNLHPRWPAGSEDSVGGRFAPAGSQGGGTAAGAAQDGGSSPGPRQRLTEAEAPQPHTSLEQIGKPNPGASNTRSEVSLTDAGLDGAVFNDGVYYENGTDTARRDNIHINLLGTIRAKIVKNALENVDSIKWSDDIANGNFGPKSNKCNLFVYDILTLAGASPGLPNGILHKYPPLPKQWADPGYHIPGWIFLSANEKPQPGDIVAQKLNYRDADGHVMIVGPYRNGELTFIGTGNSNQNMPWGTVEIIPAKAHLGHPGVTEGGPVTFRRYVGNQ